VTYAIWSGVGLVLINIFAAVKYGQMPNSITTLGMAFIILGVVLVNFNTGVD
jgi:small multidrug resistance pump